MTPDRLWRLLELLEEWDDYEADRSTRTQRWDVQRIIVRILGSLNDTHREEAA